MITFPLTHTVIHTYTYTSLVGLFAESFQMCGYLLHPFIPQCHAMCFPIRQLYQASDWGSHCFLILSRDVLPTCPFSLTLIIVSALEITTAPLHPGQIRAGSGGQFLLPHSPIVPIPITFELDSWTANKPCIIMCCFLQYTEW